MTRPSPPLPIVHVGFPKSGSTSIQRDILSRLDACYVSRRGNGGPEQHWGLYDQLSRALTSGRDLDAARDAWREFTRRQPPTRLRIFSDERISMPGRGARHTTLVERCELVEDVFGPARVILVLRNPFDHLRSLYQHAQAIRYERFGWVAPFDIWLEHCATGDLHRKGSFAQVVHFADLALRYAELFGRDNVGVFFLEDLKADPVRFAKEILEFVGAPDAAGRTKLRRRNVTSEKRQIAAIDRVFPGFGAPRMPDDYVRRALPLIHRQARLLHDHFGMAALSRWPDLAASTGVASDAADGSGIPARSRTGLRARVSGKLGRWLRG